MLIVCTLIATSASADQPSKSKADSQSDYAATARTQKDVSQSTSGRAKSIVTRTQLEERLPRSAPDALRYEPGVYIQQTAHGQASTFVRGLTGQQVLLMFDGVRLNNGTYRQGPNQYFFTVDSNTIDHIEVVRGSASTLYGADALGGVVLTAPLSPDIELNKNKWTLKPQIMGRYASADSQGGGRTQVTAQLGKRTGFLAGFGYRHVGLLESGGIVRNPADRQLPRVPQFTNDGRTQLGTGFKEATFDGRLVHKLKPNLDLIAAVYGYRQYDAPRTDQCPPPYAPLGECLNIKEQFRTLSYVALRGALSEAIPEFDLTLSSQDSREARELNRPQAFARNDGLDHVYSSGAALRARTKDFKLAPNTTWALRLGGDAYRDKLNSVSSLTFTDLNRTIQDSRGQYLDNSHFTLAGAYGEIDIQYKQLIRFRTGARVSLAHVDAPSDPASASVAIDKNFHALVGRAGIEFTPHDDIAIYANVDQAFRAPNLDDLTSRQRAGPGFQFENPNLKPERSVTAELGSKVFIDHFTLEGWVFETWIDDSMVRSTRLISDCPADTDACQAAWNRYQLVNAFGQSRLVGSEGGVTAHFSLGKLGDLVTRATISYVRGDSPNTSPQPADPNAPYSSRIPLSKVPPLNGTFEARWRDLHSGVYAAAAMRWARTQDRLSPADYSDARIPLGGTPGYTVFDLRAGWRTDQWLLSLVFENIFDNAYRVHGSSINGPGRGVIASATLMM